MKDPADIMMVTYNRLQLTKKTLDHLFENTYYPYRLLIADNGSKDGTVEYLRDVCDKKVKELEQFVGYDIKPNKENKGIAIGRNQTLSMSSNNWLVTFDNDVWVPKGWLTECIDILQANRQYGAIGVNMENTNYPLVTLNGKIFMDKPRGNLGTACMVFNRSLHKMIGWFNCYDYGRYGEEDADFGFRTRVVGLKLGYIKENGKHLGEGEYDTGEYREFKTASHKRNLSKFNENCRAYASRQKPVYILFKDE